MGFLKHIACFQSSKKVATLSVPDLGAELNVLLLKILAIDITGKCMTPVLYITFSISYDTIKISVKTRFT
jgi:hypothetical protein